MVKNYNTEYLTRKIESQTILEFSERLYTCDSIEQLRLALRTYLKKIIQFEIFRVAIENQHEFYTFTFAGSEVLFSKNSLPSLLKTEQNMVKMNSNYRKEGIEEPFFHDVLEAFPVQGIISRGFIQKQGERKILVSLIYQETEGVTEEKILTIKHFINAFSRRLNEILLESQLLQKQEQLQKARKTIQQLKNKKIELLAGQRQANIKKNEKLLWVSVLTSHHLREPLTRVQGLLSLFDFTDVREQKEVLIPQLNTSVNEMDSILKKVLKMMSNELKQTL